MPGEKKGKGEGVTRQLLRYETQCWRWEALRCAIWICSWMTNSAEFKQDKMFLPTCLASHFLDFSQYCVSCVYLSFLSEILFISQVMNMITDMRDKQLGSGKTHEMPRVYWEMENSPTFDIDCCGYCVLPSGTGRFWFFTGIKKCLSLFSFFF